MFCKIDWISLTIPTNAPFVGGSDMVFQGVLELAVMVLPDVFAPISIIGEWEVQQGRGVYQFARMHTKTKIRLSFGDVNADIYLEISGQACDSIRGFTTLEKIFQAEDIRLSRVDLACDYETDLSVDLIIGKGYKATFKSRADWRTEDGDTTYIGSRKSERMLRVYRYHKPHPRSHLLRCEVELKGDAAKAIGRRIIASGETQACADALAIFDLQHELIRESIPTASPLRAAGSDKAKKGTARWFLKQVKPALLKAHKNGEFDVRGLLAQILFSEMR